MKKRSIIFILTVVCSHLLAAQSPQRGTVTGKIIDAENLQPISSATIRILHQKDSTLVTGLSSKTDGSFSVSVDHGAYITQISFMGYQDIFRDISVTTLQPSVRLDTISLHESPILLEEAVITALPPEIV
uniref:carboxypeptidase-like regulatory domain-containing protein n=1 Tax=uncultured Proteiniphilum sp. TaxID=497637 RepID=UPI002614607C